MIYGIPPRNSPNKDLHAYWDGFLSQEDITYLLNLEEWLNLEEASVVKNSAEHEFVTDKNIRKTKVSWLGLNEANKEIWIKFSNVVAEINRHFFKFDLNGFYEPMQLGLYDYKNQSHYTWHIDANNKSTLSPRKLSIVLMLSDPKDFDGGELQIKTYSDDPISLEQQQGRAWFFPSYVLHRVTPVTRGIRKSLVLWASGPEFK